MTKKEEINGKLNSILFSAYITGKENGDNRTFHKWEEENQVCKLFLKEVGQYGRDERVDELDKIAEDCPNCPNQGWYEVTGTYINPNNGEPEPQQEQEQCQFCYEQKNSRFNIENRIKELE